MGSKHVCPDHGPIGGLGVCWEDTPDGPCLYDARVQARKEKEGSSQAEGLSEKQIQHQIRQFLQLRGYEIVDTSQPHQAKITPGLADLMVFGENRFCFAEIKSAKGRPTQAQDYFSDICEWAGVEYHVWRSVEDARQWDEEG